MTKLFLVIPCYNEELVIKDTADALSKKFSQLILENKISQDSKIVFIDDGSNDKTWEIIESLYNSDKMFRGIKLSTNRGHQNALMCGLSTLKDECDAIITIDADLQDDINVFDKMLSEYENGSDVVYGVRESRKTDSFFKRFTAQMYYKTLKRMGAKVIFNHADFRLMSKRAVNSLCEFKEVNLFLRGMIPLVGYKYSIVKYDRKKRDKGESKYSLRKMLSLAWEGITSLSVKPIKLVTKLGLIIFLLSIIMLLYFLIRFLCGATVVGWASLAVSIWAIGGLELLAIGIVGEYIGKIYLETKARPRFIVETYLTDTDEKSEK